MHLLDVNVLIARADDSHVHHNLAKSWMATQTGGWATCPITENGLLRILGNPKYPGNGAGSPEGAAVALRGMIAAVPGHRFLPDNISLVQVLPSLSGIRSAHLTDVYLLALAIDHGARFLTLDRRIDPALVPGGPPVYQRLQ